MPLSHREGSWREPYGSDSFAGISIWCNVETEIRHDKLGADYPNTLTNRAIENPQSRIFEDIGLYEPKIHDLEM
jgi:hypothetical protein